MIGNLTQLILTLAICDDYTYIHDAGSKIQICFSARPLLYDYFQHAHFVRLVGVEKERRTFDCSVVTYNGSARYWNYLEDY